MRLALAAAVALVVGGCMGGNDSSLPTGSFGRGCVRAQVANFSGGPGDPIRAALVGDGGTAVVLANTSGGNLCDWVPFAQDLERRGYAVLLFDYGQQSPDVEVAAAGRFLRREGFERIILGGASQGAKAVILAAAAGAPTAGVLSLSPERYLGGIDVMPAARRLRVPILYVTATGDTWSNRAAPALYRATGSPERRLLRVPGQAHGTDLLPQPKVRAAIDAFLERR